MKSFLKLCLLITAGFFGMLIVLTLGSASFDLIKGATGPLFDSTKAFLMMLFSLILPFLALGFYMLPYFVARSRSHSNATAIGLLNLFLGWTLLGWLGALIWAVANPPGSAPAKTPF